MMLLTSPKVFHKCYAPPSLLQVPINATALLAGPLYEEQYCILGLPCAILLHGFNLRMFNNIIITLREEGSACGDRHQVPLGL